MKGAGLTCEELSKGVFGDKRTAGTLCLVSFVTGRLCVYKLAPYPSLSDMWVLLLIMDLGLFVIFKKLSTENPHFEIESLSHVARVLKVFSTRYKGGLFISGSC